VLAREALLPRRLGRVVVFAAAAALAAWAAWPKPGVSHVTESEFTAIAIVVLLALAPRFSGAASPSRAGRFLRVFCYAALLVFLAAQGSLEAFTGLVPPRAGHDHADDQVGMAAAVALPQPAPDRVRHVQS